MRLALLQPSQTTLQTQIPCPFQVVQKIFMLVQALTSPGSCPHTATNQHTHMVAPA